MLIASRAARVVVRQACGARFGPVVNEGAGFEGGRTRASIVTIMSRRRPKGGAVLTPPCCNKRERAGLTRRWD